MVITRSSPTRPTTNATASSAETPDPHAIDTVIAIPASMHAKHRSFVRHCRYATSTAPPGHENTTPREEKNLSVDSDHTVLTCTLVL